MGRTMYLARAARWAAVGITILSAFPASAQDWPTKPIRIISPYAAGGVGDTLFRLISPAVETRLGQRFIIENKTGAAGNIGTSDVVRADPDGYTFIFAPTANFAVNQFLFKNLGFDPVTQLEPVTAMAEAPLIAIVSSGVTATSLKELAEQVRKDTTKFNYASPGAGSPTHLAGASFSRQTSDAISHISYRGTPPMVQGLLANDVQLAFPTLQPVDAQIKAGKLRALAVMGSQRLPQLSNVPTTIEAGFPELIFGNWWVLAAPKKTDPRIIQRLSEEFHTALADPAIRARLADLGHVALDLGPKESKDFIRAEAERYKTLINSTGITLE